jgi:hypothetical protein
MEKSEERSLAAKLYNQCWEILESFDGTSDQMATLLTNAFTSRFHWLSVGEAQQHICADWMVARAASAADFGDLAILFALRAYEAANGAAVDDWLRASVAEGLARAYAAAGDETLREQWLETAQTLVDAISDDEDRDIIAGQLSTVPR